MKKFFCIVSNILLSLVYIPVSTFPAVMGFLFFVYGSWSWSLQAVVGFLCCLLLVLTPIFCVLGIVLSVIQRKRQNYSSAFLVQFLPFATLGICAVLFFVGWV